MAPTRTILVTSASGNIGTELMPLLVKESNTNLVLPTRNADRLRSSVPASTSANVAIEEGDLADPNWMQSILTRHAVDTVFLCLHGAVGSELDTTLNILDAMARAGTVRQCVYVSICGDFVSPAGIAHLTAHCAAGHMLVKIPIESRLRHGGYPFATTVLGPSLFFTNDARSKRSLLDRAVFDEPVDRASRVHPADIALAARNVMFAGPAAKYAGRKIQLGSWHVYSGAEVAGVWSRALGKEVRGWHDAVGDLDAFEKQHAEGWGPAFARDIRLMYESFAAMGFGMSEEEYALQVEVLGREASDYGPWVDTVAKGWLAEG